MITLFACPKPFEDPHISVIQRNAIRSWTMLGPEVQIILFGSEPGIAEVADEFGCEHVPSVQRNDYGTPLLNDVFAQAESLARHRCLGYVNADIILMDDFVGAVKAVATLRRDFLLGGRPWNLDVASPVDFCSGWQRSLTKTVRASSNLRSENACDYFVFPKLMWKRLPPFVIGRCYFDGALLYRARKQGALLIDGTDSIVAVHQQHEYERSVGGENYLVNPEALANVALAGGFGHLYTWRNAAYRLSVDRIERSWRGTLNVLGPWSRSRRTFRGWIWHPFLRATRPLRHLLGLRSRRRCDP